MWFYAWLAQVLITIALGYFVWQENERAEEKRSFRLVPDRSFDLLRQISERGLAHSDEGFSLGGFGAKISVFEVDKLLSFDLIAESTKARNGVSLAPTGKGWRALDWRRKQEKRG